MNRALLALSALLLAAPALATTPEGSDLHTWGKLAPFKKTGFFQLQYKELQGKKRKSVKAYLKLEEAEFFVDRQVSLAALEEGAKVWIYGKPVERESTDDDGRAQVDRQIVNTLALAFGDALAVDADRAEGPAGQKWLEATVTKPGENLHVQYDGSEYKVVCLRGFAVLARQALAERPKLKKKLFVEVLGQSTDERPEKAKDGEQSFAAQRVVVLDKRLQKVVYPLLLN